MFIISVQQVDTNWGIDVVSKQQLLEAMCSAIHCIEEKIAEAPRLCRACAKKVCEYTDAAYRRLAEWQGLQFQCADAPELPMSVVAAKYQSQIG